jgi:hypothetical protein
MPPGKPPDVIDCPAAKQGPAEQPGRPLHFRIRQARAGVNGTWLIARARRAPAAIAAVAAAVTLAACSLSTEEIATSYVAPGKFDLSTCKEINDGLRERAERVRKLQELIDKAGREAGGEVVAALAYRTEYVTTYGELRVLQDTAVRKNCSDRSRSISDRSMW